MPADAAVLAAFAERTFREAFAADNVREDMDAYCASSFGAAIQAREIAMPDRYTLLGERAGEPIAYLQLRADRRPDGIDGLRPLEIQRFYVDGRHHGGGVAAELMRQALACAEQHGADVLWLGVWERNARAQAFYAKWGFRVVGSQSFTLGSDVQRDLLMARAT